jgi:hypothetical protein
MLEESVTVDWTATSSPSFRRLPLGGDTMTTDGVVWLGIRVLQAVVEMRSTRRDNGIP